MFRYAPQPFYRMGRKWFNRGNEPHMALTAVGLTRIAAEVEGSAILTDEHAFVERAFGEAFPLQLMAHAYAIRESE